MNDLRVIEEREYSQYRKENIRQLSTTQLTNFSHGEERKSSMRDGFYTRRYRSLL